MRRMLFFICFLFYTVTSKARSLILNSSTMADVIPFGEKTFGALKPIKVGITIGLPLVLVPRLEMVRISNSGIRMGNMLNISVIFS